MAGCYWTNLTRISKKYLVGSFALVAFLSLATPARAEDAAKVAETAKIDEATDAEAPIADLKKPAAKDTEEYPSEDSLFDEKASGSAPASDSKPSLDGDVPNTTGYDAEERRQLGEFRLGPTMSLGLPHPLNYGLDFVFGNTFGGAFSLGALRTKVQDTSVSLSNWDIRLRWFPRHDCFFVGAAVGQQKATGEISRAAIDGGAAGKVNGSMSLTANTKYISPHVGWFNVWESGFTLGFDAGVQLAASYKESFSSRFEGNLSDEQIAQLRASNDYKKLEQDAMSVAKKIGKNPLPYIAARAGWLF